MYFAEWKKPDLKGYLLYASIYMAFWKKTMAKETDEWLPGAASGGLLTKGQHREFRVREQLCAWVIVLVDT